MTAATGLTAAATTRKRSTAIRPLKQEDYEALAQVRYEVRRFLTFSEEKARGAGIEPQQHQLLLALKALSNAGRPTIGALAKRLLIRHHSAVELVTRSVKSGLVRRSPRSGDDRRTVTLRMTKRGERLLAALSVVHRNELRSAAPALLQAIEAIIASNAVDRRLGARPRRVRARTESSWGR
jgi:DNA-binding MarR family transcriptional regulator